ncbi:MAG: magnesium-protoporphyrin IX monomethyl ester (oxidative) cyclase, partial [Pseudomonadota bacterium]
DIENPRWMKGLRVLQRANADLAAAKTEGKVIKRLTASARAAMAFAALLTIPSNKNDIPVKTRLEPAY